METGPLFIRIYNCNKKFVVCQGGGDSLKTSDILKVLAVKCTERSNTVCTVTGHDLPNLKGGPLRLFKNYIATHPEITPYIKTFNKSESTYYFKNSSIIEFKSFEDEQDARGSERDYLFINECNGVPYNIFWQLQRKTRIQVFVDYNPTSKFYIHHKLLGETEKSFIGKVQLYVTDHRHNPFLSKEDHEAYENISDPELFRVYSRGLTGNVSGVIYRMKKVDKIPEGLPFGFGIDFGYNADQSAIVKVWFDKRDRYYQQLLYKSENEILTEIIEKKLDITPADYMSKILKENGCTTSTLVWGDHDKMYSTAFRKNGIPFRMARKGPNSVIMGIAKVKECNNYYIGSPHLEKELETYIWETAIDILTGNEVTTNQPIDGMPDHLLAAIRYFDFSYGMRFGEVT